MTKASDLKQTGRREPLNLNRIRETIPQRKRPRRNHSLTVAIACEFDDGLLFCADTKLSTGNEKRNESKIHWGQWTPANAATVFTLAGDVDYAVAAIDKCEQAIARLDLGESSLDNMQELIERVLAGFYQMHIFPHPSRREVDFNLLIGLLLNGEIRFLVTKETAVRKVRGYECIGSGGYLARYCLRQALGQESAFDPSKLTLPEATLIMEHAINSAVEYDEACGYNAEAVYVGEGEFVGMTRDGQIGDIREPTFLITFPEELQSETWTLLRRMARFQNPAEQEIAIEEFCDRVRGLYEPVRTFTAGMEAIEARAQASEEDDQ